MSRLVYGIHPVEELLRSRREVAVLYLVEGDRAAAKLAEAARQARVAVEPRSRAELDTLVDGKLHQGAVAVAGDYPYLEPHELLDRALSHDEPPLLLVLDGVQDPQNLGALVRSAHVLGAHGVLLPRDRSAKVTATVVKASAGATEHLPIALCTNLARTLDELRERGLWTVGAVAEDEGGEVLPPWRVDLRAATALVLGAEGKGLRPLTLRGCDLRVAIPMAGRAVAGQVGSLNVSAAGAALLYEAARQRRTD